MRVLGLMSGTSVDGVDAAVADLDLDGDRLRMTMVGHVTVDWPDELRSQVMAVLPPATTSARDVCRLDHDLGAGFADAATRALARLGVDRVDLVASHGQTVYHDVHPNGSVHGTLQLGQPAEIAERLGVPVIADFRVRDVAAGGQGAPLVSMLDHLLLAGTGRPSGLLNLGGIANLTVVRPGKETLAFDCGPANALLDIAFGDATGERFDAGGTRTARGTVDEDLLAVLLEDPYLAQPPPKSTGKERYHRGYLADALVRAPVPDADDLLATLAEAVAVAIATDVDRLGVTAVWASGGGVHNAGLMGAIRRRLVTAGAELATSDALGLPADHKEAYAFALLGWLTWHGLPGSVSSSTGARGPRILGSLVPGNGPLRLPEPIAEAPSRLVIDPSP